MNHLIHKISKVAHEYAKEKHAQLELERSIDGKKGYDNMPRVKDIFAERIIDIVINECFEEIEKHQDCDSIKEKIINRF